MHNQSDYGYSTGSYACIACGSTELACCDGTGRKLTPLEKAVHYLATQMLNQVGVEWDECCDSAEIAAKRLRWRDGYEASDEEVTANLYAEAYRYEDMRCPRSITCATKPGSTSNSSRRSRKPKTNFRPLSMTDRSLIASTPSATFPRAGAFAPC